jgi:hypothetical protein
MYLSVDATRKHLLMLLNIKNAERFSMERADSEVKAHYGSYPLEMAEIWYDLCHFDQLSAALRFKKREKTMKGFKQYAMAMYWLWTYPKNAKVFASHFRSSERHTRGKPLHIWIQRIEALKVKKIKWDDEIDNRNAPTFFMTVDGTDFREEEKPHPLYHRDEKQYTVKFKRCGCKFEIGISVWKSQVLWVNGPFRGGKPDKEIFEEGLGPKIPAGKLAIVDRGYTFKDKDVSAKVSLPRPTDSKRLNNFKSRARSRHETFNGRMKDFASLSGQYFRHGGGGADGRKFYGEVIVAIIVILQYQMDNGRELFAV